MSEELGPDMTNPEIPANEEARIFFDAMIKIFTEDIHSIRVEVTEEGDSDE